MDQLKARRLELGLSQSQMANLMGIHTNTYACWERDVKRPHEGLVRVTMLLLEMVESRAVRRLLL